MKFVIAFSLLSVIACTQQEKAVSKPSNPEVRSADTIEKVDEEDKDVQEDDIVQVDDRDDDGYSCPEQPELIPLPFKEDKRQFVLQHQGTNCNGLQYVAECSVESLVAADASNKGKALSFGKSAPLIVENKEAGFDGYSGLVFLEFKVLHDKTDVEISYAGLDLNESISFTIVKRDNFDRIANAEVLKADAAKSIGKSLFNPKVNLDAGLYSLRVFGDKAELSDLSIKGSQDLEDLGIVKLKGAVGFDGCD